MQRLLYTFATKITPTQSMKMFTAPKSAKRSWTEHYLYLVAVSEACGGADNLVLDNIVHYADPVMKVSMLSRLNLARTDYLRQAEKLAHFAQSTEIEMRGKQQGRDEINDAHEGRTDTRKCFKCGKPGHLKAVCTSKKMDWRDTGDADFGSSRHLVNDLALLEDLVDYEIQCVAADGGTLRVSKRGSVMLVTTAMGNPTRVRLLNVQYAANLERNIISYGLLEAKRYGLAYRGSNRVIAPIDGGPAIFDVKKSNNVMTVRTLVSRSAKGTSDVQMSVLAENEAAVEQDVQTGPLMHFHRRLGHLNYDTITRMAKKPASGVALSDEVRANCLDCAEDKQNKNKQSRMDTGGNSPIDVIGGIICSDLKGPMTPRDRLGNRYVVNFVDHRTNYCRGFLAKTKDVAALKFKHFMAFFERQFNCRIHVLGTDGGGEYKTLNLFCKDTGIARRVSEQRNQASNGKAERMHCTIMNMVGSMVFTCGLLLSFWGDAAEYAA
ncbi:hypothetical protein PC115_g6420 [Phytophthora cactorum]|uniref:CCHC-type domain-containing protein n=3 Tax=Phytophthora cactorum TaxID=29920 RepID=A0A8T1CZF8_9STRA|nr:hypothetical protein PC115_g6420 [Phytophthora cactorum]KAG3178320.1 hypothetical protein C6341_g8050 [Phytophthora cactorum]